MGIFGVQKSDIGIYTCSATNKMIHQTKKLPVKIELQVEDTSSLSLGKSGSNKAEQIEYSVGQDKSIILPGCGQNSKWETYSSIRLEQFIQRQEALIIPTRRLPKNEVKIICSNKDYRIIYQLTPKGPPRIPFKDRYKYLSINSGDR